VNYTIPGDSGNAIILQKCLECSGKRLEAWCVLLFVSMMRCVRKLDRLRGVDVDEVARSQARSALLEAPEASDADKS